MAGIFRRLAGWRWRRSLIYGTGTLIALIALFYAVEDFRGKRAWDNNRREWEAKGERFDVASFIPLEPVPDDQNFAKAEIITKMEAAEKEPEPPPQAGGRRRIILKAQTNFSSLLRPSVYGSEGPHGAEPYGYEIYSRGGIFQAPVDWPTNGVWQLGVMTDLKEWQAYYRNPPKYVGAKIRAEAFATVEKPYRMGMAAYYKWNSNRVAVISARAEEMESRPTNEFTVGPEGQPAGVDVIQALSKYDETIEAVKKVAKTPGMRFPIQIEKHENQLPALPSALVSSAEVLELRAIAELSINESEEALDDTRTILSIAESLRQQPTAGAQRARWKMIGRALQCIWDGLARRSWSETQLAELERILGALDYFDDYARVTRTCRALTVDHIEAARENHNAEVVYDTFDNLDGMDWLQNRLEVFAAHHFPSGWYYQNELRACRSYTEQILPELDFDNRIVSPKLANLLQSRNGSWPRGFWIPFWEPDRLRIGPYNILLYASLVVVEPETFVYAEGSVNLARVGCALKRYWLKFGEYPETLDVLEPAFIEKLPHDVMNGKPLHYHRTENGRFTLYSVGWDGLDHQGAAKVNKEGRLTGNWVWRYP